MKTKISIIIAGLLVGLSQSCQGQVKYPDAPSPLAPLLASPPNGTNWMMTFNDEFSGTSLDTSKWTSGLAFHYEINNDEAGFIPEQLQFHNGILLITAELGLRKTAGNGNAWCDDFVMTVSQTTPILHRVAPKVNNLATK
jgi:hypothetical protein